MIFIKSKKQKAEEAALLKEQQAAERAAYEEEEKREAKAAKQAEHTAKQRTKQAEREEAKKIKVDRSETSSTGYRAAKGSVDASGKKIGGQFIEPTTSQLGTSGDMVMTLQAIYQETTEQGEMIDESDEHLEDIQAIQEQQLDELEGTGSEQRQERITESNTDKKEKGMLSKFVSGIKGAFGSVGDAYGSVKKSLSGKFGLVLLGGGLMLMNKYSDELFGPEGILTRFLEWMHDDMAPAIKKLYDKVAIGIDKAWAGVASFFTWVHKVFTAISDYIKEFDTDGVPGLSETERKELLEDLGEKAGEAVGTILKAGLGALALWLGTAAAGSLLWTAMKGRVFGMAAGTVVGTPITAAVATTTAATLGMAAILIGGLLILQGKITDAYNEAIEDEEGNVQKFDAGEFVSRILSGKDNKEGMGWWDAFNNSFDNMLAGAAVGITAGAIAGAVAGVPTGGLLSGPLALGGAIIGGITFGLAGMLGMHMGEDKLNQVMDDADKRIGDASDGFMDTARGVVDWAVDMLNIAKGIMSPDKTAKDVINEIENRDLPGDATATEVQSQTNKNINYAMEKFVDASSLVMKKEKEIAELKEGRDEKLEHYSPDSAMIKKHQGWIDKAEKELYTLQYNRSQAAYLLSTSGEFVATDEVPEMAEWNKLGYRGTHYDDWYENYQKTNAFLMKQENWKYLDSIDNWQNRYPEVNLAYQKFESGNKEKFASMGLTPSDMSFSIDKEDTFQTSGPVELLKAIMNVKTRSLRPINDAIMRFGLTAPPGWDVKDPSTWSETADFKPMMMGLDIDKSGTLEDAETKGFYASLAAPFKPKKHAMYMAAYAEYAAAKGLDNTFEAATNFANTQISADQNTQTNVNYRDDSMSIYLRDTITNSLNSSILDVSGVQ